ncbi:MAG: oligosaccharide repeat unit polymerase [Lachnospiraceae bacterium]|nr:oligosaccharide repeat unit polymerase [Lachnospiraceae bacterium]
MNSGLHKLCQKLQIQSGVEALAAALFTLAATTGTLWICKDLLYGTKPVYEEMVAGGTIWDGYNKQGDLTLFYLLFLLIPIYFGAFLLIKHSLQKKAVECQHVTEEMKKKPVAKEWIAKAIVIILLGTESVRAVQTALIGMFPLRQQQLDILGLVGTIVWIVIVCAFFIRYQRKMDHLLIFAQICLPLQFLGYYKFYYRFEAEEGLIQLFYSAKWKWICLLLFAAFFGWQLYAVFRKRTGVYVSSLILVAIGRTAQGPEGILSVDFFHNGEMAFPMQQLVSYGKLPYFDIDPIHGLCDYFYSVINYMLFDGTYFSQNAAIFVAGIMMAAVLAFTMGVCFKNRYMAFFILYLFMPYLVQKAGVRYLLFFVAFMILMSEKARNDSLRFLWWWVLLCIVAIFWNVSIGSSMAVAFLPEVLYRVIKDVIPRLKHFREWGSSDKKKFLGVYGVLFVIGLCYIPWFLQILRFLSENAGTTLYVNGTAIFGDEFQWVNTFAILIPYIAVLIYALCGYKKGKSAFVTMFACLLVISNYACVRYDEGARLAVLAVFFMMLWAVEVLEQKELNQQIRMGILAIFAVLCVWLIRHDITFVGAYTAVADVPASKEIHIMGEDIDDPVVFVSGESVGMPALGTGFIQGNTLNSLKNVKAVLDAELTDEAYMDLTNKISHFVIMDKESVLPFTSAYNISNAKMQEKAIALVGEKRPRLILISPLIQFDLAPVSLRSMKFYESLLDMGYEPYTYGDVVYLLDGDSTFVEALGDDVGRKSFGMYCHKEHLGMLPLAWGTAWEKQAGQKADNGVYHDVNVEWIEAQDGVGQYVVKTAEGAFDGGKVSYVVITATGGYQRNESFTLNFMSDVDGQEYKFRIDCAEEEAGEVIYLIPVGSSPFWHYSEIEEIVLSGQLPDITNIAFY